MNILVIWRGNNDAQEIFRRRHIGELKLVGHFTGLMGVFTGNFHRFLNHPCCSKPTFNIKFVNFLCEKDARL